MRTKKRGGKTEALAALADFFTELETTGQRKPDVRTFGYVLTEYLEHCRRIGRKRSTLESYEMAFKRVPQELKDKPVRDLEAHDLDELYGTLELAPNTIRQTHAVLHAALDQAVTWEWLPANPADRATPPMRPKQRRRPLELLDIRRMIDRAISPKPEGEDDLVLAMAIALAAITGARRGELCGLRWEDIDATTGTLRIERQWVPGVGGQYLTTPKSADGERSVVLGEAGLALLERYRARAAEHWGLEPAEWILSPDGISPYRAKSLGYQITALGERLGLEVTTHSFRRASATQLVASGVDVDSAARRLGHTKEVMLGSYVLGADDRQRAAGDALEARFASAGLPLAELIPGE